MAIKGRSSKIARSSRSIKPRICKIAKKLEVDEPKRREARERIEQEFAEQGLWLFASSKNGQ
jgi:hypothetical protein